MGEDEVTFSLLYSFRVYGYIDPFKKKTMGKKTMQGLFLNVLYNNVHSGPSSWDMIFSKMFIQYLHQRNPKIIIQIFLPENGKLLLTEYKTVEKKVFQNHSNNILAL